MKLGTRTRYASRAMVDLALHYGGGEILATVKEISSRQQFSPKYLETLNVMVPEVECRSI